MSSLSALAIRVCTEINDATNNTFSAGITGTNYSELQSYVVDGIRDYAGFVYREVFDNSIVTSANLRTYVVSTLSPTPVMLKKVEYVYSSTGITNVPDVELFSGSMYLFDRDRPIFTNTAGNYFNIWYLGSHSVPSAGSAALTIDSGEDEIILNYAKSKAMYKQALDQRGINQDTANEFLALAKEFERNYKDGVRRSQQLGSFTSYK